MLAMWLVVASAQNQHMVRIEGDENYDDRTLVYDGIDVSRHQKDIDWRTTASDKNIQYVYIKATEGATHVSTHYRRNIENARKHGIKVGSYHFLRTTSSIRRQFENFTRVVKIEEQDLIPLLDVEKRGKWSNKQLQDSVKLFADLLEAHYGCRPMIYSNTTWFNNYLGPQFANYPLFIARYSKTEPQLNYGAKWILWQFSDKGRIKGIDANVDLSRFNKGCSLNDILINKKKTSPRNRGSNQRSVTSVPYPKKRMRPVQQEVPMSPRQRKEAEEKRKAEMEKQKNAPKEAKRKEKEEREKRRKEEEARKKQEKERQKAEREQREREKKESERLRKEREKEERKQRNKERMSNSFPGSQSTTTRPANTTTNDERTRKAFGRSTVTKVEEQPYNSEQRTRIRNNHRGNGASSDN